MGRQGHALSHWHTLLDDFQTSALEFYTSVEQELARRDVPNAQTERVLHREGGVITAQREYLRVTRQRLAFDLCAAPFGKSQFFSWWLVERRSPYARAIGFAGLFLLLLWLVLSIFKFGGPFWGLVVFILGVVVVLLLVRSMADAGSTGLEDGVLTIPVVGPMYGQIFRPTTYFSLDTALMFQESVRRAVSTVIGDLRSAQGLRALSPEEERPQLTDLLK